MKVNYDGSADENKVRSEATSIVLLRNMVGPGEVDDTLQHETADECSKYGKVERCLIFEVMEPLLFGDSVGLGLVGLGWAGLHILPAIHPLLRVALTDHPFLKLGFGFSWFKKKRCLNHKLEQTKQFVFL